MIQPASNPVGPEETQCPQCPQCPVSQECPTSPECPVCQECPECQGEVANQETEEICPATGSCILMSSFCKPNLLSIINVQCLSLFPQLLVPFLPSVLVLSLNICQKRAFLLSLSK